MTAEKLDLADLRAKSEAATPGPWAIWDLGWNPELGIDEVRVDCADGVVAEALPHNSAFIAAANPQTVLALLDLLAERDATIAESDSSALAERDRANREAGWELGFADRASGTTSIRKQRNPYAKGVTS